MRNTVINAKLCNINVNSQNKKQHLKRGAFLWCKNFV